MNNNRQELLQKYLETLSPIELIAMEIAKQHLGSSFNIFKSNGYMKWIKTYMETIDKNKNKIPDKIPDIPIENFYAIGDYLIESFNSNK